MDEKSDRMVLCSFLYNYFTVLVNTALFMNYYKWNWYEFFFNKLVSWEKKNDSSQARVPGFIHGFDTENEMMKVHFYFSINGLFLQHVGTF